MFQMATTSALAWRNNTTAHFNMDSYHLPLQGRPASNYIDNIYKGASFKTKEEFDDVARTYYETQYNYSPIDFTDDTCLVGYFQSEKYFVDFEEKIRELFRCTSETEARLKNKYGDLLQGNTTSVHIRRGDYLNFSQTHPLLTKEYYIKAMSRIPQTEKYLIFSDDIPWCLNNFKLNNFYIVEGEKDYVDLCLMSKCKNNIIANSSFSWWGAWLNENSDKIVIAPTDWFGTSVDHDTKDLIPEGWIKT